MGKIKFIRISQVGIPITTRNSFNLRVLHFLHGLFIFFAEQRSFSLLVIVVVMVVYRRVVVGSYVHRERLQRAWKEALLSSELMHIFQCAFALIVDRFHFLLVGLSHGRFCARIHPTIFSCFFQSLENTARYYKFLLRLDSLFSARGGSSCDRSRVIGMWSKM